MPLKAAPLNWKIMNFRSGGLCISVPSLFPQLNPPLAKYFPHHLYDTNYGLSESAGPGCVHLGVENIDKVGAIGLPGYGWEAKLLMTRETLFRKAR